MSAPYWHDPGDAQRLRHIAENPEILRFLYDMLGEVYCTSDGIRTGLKKPESDSLAAIRSLIDADMDDKAHGRNAYAVSLPGERP